jgi:hypothetical protein
MTMSNFGQILSIYLLLQYTYTCSSQPSSAWFKLTVSGMYSVYQKQVIRVSSLYMDFLFLSKIANKIKSLAVK